MYKWLYTLLVLSSFIACSDDSESDEISAALEARLAQLAPNGEVNYFVLPSSTDYAAIPQDPNNPLTKEKVLLGQLLFHEPAMGVIPVNSKGGKTYSCASCHHAGSDFHAGVRQGIGEGGTGFGFFGEGRKLDPGYRVDDIDVQPIRTPTILNVAFQEAMLWNGQFGAPFNDAHKDKWTQGTPLEANWHGFEGVETQAIAGMGVHRQEVNREMVEEAGYKALFDLAFPDTPEDERYSTINAALAIAAYERTVMSNEAPFQKWLKGDKDAMTVEAMKGALIFFDKGECFECHTGPALNSMRFEAYGMGDLLGGSVIKSNTNNKEHLGRGGFTRLPEDMYKFKVPQLYNLNRVKFLGHGGTFHSLREVVEYKNIGRPENQRVPDTALSPYFHPLDLDHLEITALMAFLQDALEDRDLSRYVPSSLPSGLCFPNNDHASKIDLNCP